MRKDPRACILRNVTPEGKLPALRSLLIHLESGNSPKSCPGHRWRENENGVAAEEATTKVRR